MTHGNRELFIPDRSQAVPDDCSLGKGSCPKANLKVRICQVASCDVEEDIVCVRQVLGLSRVNGEGSMKKWIGGRGCYVQGLALGESKPHYQDTSLLLKSL